jgi:hypothetical protein
MYVPIMWPSFIWKSKNRISQEAGKQILDTQERYVCHDINKFVEVITCLREPVVDSTS